MACGIFLDQELNLSPAFISRWILNHNTVREILQWFLNEKMHKHVFKSKNHKSKIGMFYNL